MSHDLIGYVAATLTTVAFVPQVLLTWRTRDTRGISLGMYAVFTVGIVCWLAYGVAIRSWPVIVSNVVTLILALVILGLKLTHRGNEGLER